MRKVSLNQLVVVSHRLDATIYLVKAVEGFNVGVIDYGIEDSVPNQALWWYDRSIFLPLSVGQLKQVTAGPVV